MAGAQLMGLLRLILATLVLISHMGIFIAGLNPGVSAVIVFYLLAGHVVSQLWQRRPVAGLAAASRWFYQDRLLRIVPLYLFALVLAAVLWALGAQSGFISRSPGWQDWLANLLIIPLNYFMYTGQEAFTLLPPAWSLGAELQFYLLVPLLLSVPWLACVAALASFAVFVLAQISVLDIDIFGYRLLAGVGFVFLAGTLLGRPERVARLSLVALWASSAIYALWLLGSDQHRPYNTEVALGMALGLPLLVIFQRLPRSGAWQTLQRRAGELSYGVFLLHFPAIWCLSLFGLSGPSTVGLVFLLSIAFAWLGHAVVERPLWHRYRVQLPARAGQ